MAETLPLIELFLGLLDNGLPWSAAEMWCEVFTRRRQFPFGPATKPDPVGRGLDNFLTAAGKHLLTVERECTSSDASVARGLIFSKVAKSFVWHERAVRGDAGVVRTRDRGTSGDEKEMLMMYLGDTDGKELFEAIKQARGVKP
jgi:hypothetical protein